ncbi:hypothetical protein JCM6882_001858 [Rhodosporidiobolus microsporus]
MFSSSSPAPAPPLGSPLDPQVYAAGREKALQIAKEQGFPEGALVELPVQWGDLDANVHVNNVVYFKWLESGRLAHVHHLTRALPKDIAADLQGSGKGKGLILARLTFDYRLPTFYPDSVMVMHRPVEYTTKKMVLETAVYSFAQQTFVGLGTAIMVAYDYDLGRSGELPQAVLDELEALGAKKVESGKGRAKL